MGSRMAIHNTVQLGRNCISIRPELLEHNIFRDSLMDTFFADEMKEFLEIVGPPVKGKKTRKVKISGRPNIPLILNKVGDSITEYISRRAALNNSTVALESLRGHIDSAVLPRWTSRLSRLKSLALWDGSALDGTVANAISEHCWDFEDLTFYLVEPNAQDMDVKLANFFTGLRANTLRSFTAIRADSIGQQTLKSLCSHAQSLKVLKLDNLRADAIKHISLLKDCVALETLALTDAEGLVNLEATENDVFLESVAWLRQCEKLRDLKFSKFFSAPAILTKLLVDEKIKLSSLEVVDYPLLNNGEFYKALSHQVDLVSLDLKTDVDDPDLIDNGVLVSSICQLTKLNYLRLIGVSDNFCSPDIQSLATHLKGLEELHFSGFNITDDILPALSGLHHLKTLSISALTNFTSDGLLAYISTLQETNSGLNIAILSQALESDLSDNELSTIKNAIAARVDGSLEYVLFREPETDFEGSDSD
ncbi:hypothetical protein BP5796_08653 [Coleophoma crateriformis]|uniref:RNI-like protein n=1 Tax=Coleophoma crateriformis TaxID=565419 RepID=A0A3D8R8F4_9HELO|nr:hypothetical protein BP5796_08653 [Coleophoma crateriformis]